MRKLILNSSLPWEGICFPSTKENSHGTQSHSIDGSGVTLSPGHVWQLQADGQRVWDRLNGAPLVPVDGVPLFRFGAATLIEAATHDEPLLADGCLLDAQGKLELRNTLLRHFRDHDLVLSRKDMKAAEPLGIWRS